MSAYLLYSLQEEIFVEIMNVNLLALREQISHNKRFKRLLKSQMQEEVASEHTIENYSMKILNH